MNQLHLLYPTQQKASFMQQINMAANGSWLDYVKLARLNKPIGIFLVLWPTLWALWLAAEGVPSIKVLLIFVAGSVLMRSAGCVINDFADRKIQY